MNSQKSKLIQVDSQQTDGVPVPENFHRFVKKTNRQQKLKKKIPSKMRGAGR